MDVHEYLTQQEQYIESLKHENYGYIEPLTEPKDTTFKTGEEHPREAGRLGGIRSGEVRRRKAERRKAMESYLADIVYTQWLQDVTEEELSDFIRWQGQRKRQATLAKKRLENISFGYDTVFAEEYADYKHFIDHKRIRIGKLKSIFRGGPLPKVSFRDAVELSANDPKRRNSFLDEIVDDMKKMADYFIGEETVGAE